MAQPWWRQYGVPQTAEHRTGTWSSILLLVSAPENAKRELRQPFDHVCGSSSHNGPKLEPALMSINSVCQVTEYYSVVRRTDVRMNLKTCAKCNWPSQKDKECRVPCR
jgi:hypothetical protein